MCTKYKVCGQRHLPGWRVSKLRRDRKGRFDKDRRAYKYFIIAIAVYGISMIGINTIWGWAKSVEQVLEVDNTYAGEVVTNKTLEESRIEHLINVIYQKAKVYGVNGYQMERTIECESRFQNIQSTAYRNGVREDSWGIAQIHLPSHPEVSREEALDEMFAIEWMASHFNTVTWFGYDRRHDRCN